MKNYSLLFILLIRQIGFTQMWVPATPFPGATGGFMGNNINTYTGWSLNDAPFINSLLVHNGELYVGGYFTSIGGILAHNIAKWNGTSWSCVGPGNFLSTEFPVVDMIEYNGNLYFTHGSTTHKWDGINFTQEGGFGYDLHVFNGSLLTLGYNTIRVNNNGTISNINFNYDTIGQAFTIEDFNNEIYIGSEKGLFKFSNGVFTNCNGITTNIPVINDIEVYNNELFCVGYFQTIGGLICNNLAKYNGTNWSSIELPLDYFPNPVLDVGCFACKNHFKVIEDKLYLAHLFHAPNQKAYETGPVIVYNGTNWSTLDFSLNHFGYGLTIEKYNGILYSGGIYSAVIMNNIITSVQNFVKLDTNILNINESKIKNIKIHPNPALSYISIETDDFNINQFSISDQMGRVVITGYLNGFKTVISVDQISQGIYHLKVDGAHQTELIFKE